MSISLNVKSSAGPKFVLEVPSLDETIGAFKVRLAEVSNIPADSQRLIFRGHVLKDAQTFHDIKAKHGLESGQTMHVVRGGAPRTASTSSSTAPASSTSSTPSVPPGSAPQQTPQATPGGANPFNMFRGGAGAMGGFGDMAEMQRQLMQNPEHFQAFMNSPLMESIMNNPDVAREIMMTNPQLRELIERNPEVGHVFNDPSTFRQMMQIARNPSLMNEMMRNTDRQMANIEMMPGGFDALRRMQENIQGPLMDAVQNGFGGNQDNANANGTNTDNPFSSLFQNTPSNTPMPNPWAPNNGVPQPAANTTQNTGSRDANVPPVAGATPPTGNAFANMFGAAGAGGGFPGMPGGGDPDQMLQMLDNPMVQQMMQNLLSDPQVIEAMIASNPQLQAMVQANPEMANMLRNPALMRSMFNPDFIRGIMQMRNAMGGAGFPAPGAMPGAMPGTVPGATPGTAPTATAPTGNTAVGTTPATTQTPPATGTAPAGTGAGTNTPPSAGNINGLMAVLNAMRGLGQGQTPTPQPEMTQEQLEEMYSSQLTQLREMGFLDTSMCLQALRQSGGNVALAVENLLNRFGG